MPLVDECRPLSSRTSNFAVTGVTKCRFVEGAPKPLAPGGQRRLPIMSGWTEVQSWPAYGYRHVTAELHGEGHIVNHKRVMRLNCRSSVESTQTTSKPAGDVAPGSVWTIPAYGPDGVRHRGSAILFQALTLNCGNLRWRWQAKGTSPQGEADNSDAPPRDGAVRSSVETAVMAVERRDGVIRQAGGINWATRRNPA